MSDQSEKLAIPIVYETQVSAAHSLFDNLRGHISPNHILEAEADRDRTARILGESGIRLVSTSGTPQGLGYDSRRFTVLGKRTSLEELMQVVHETAPDLEVVEKTPLAETLTTDFDQPFVLKRPLFDHRGINKYLINNLDQVETLRRFSAATPYNAADWYTEPYIETPGGVNSSYRVVVTATGLVIASALIYKPREKGQKVTAKFREREHRVGDSSSTYRVRTNEAGWVPFADPESEWFLNADAVTSNASTGGIIIPLKIDGEIGIIEGLASQDKKVIKKHGIKALETPKDLLDYAAILGRGVGPSMALLLGIDFLQDKNGKRKLLEINPYPRVESILKWWGLDPSGVREHSDKQDRVSDDLLRVVGDSLRKMQE